MMTPVSADALLAHAQWVRAFARALVAEDSDDVAQDAWIAAIRHGELARPWFATVMRNAVRMRWRSATRRRLREEASEPTEATLSPEQLAQRMELQQKLAAAVVALDEPYRSTIVLVFYEGLSPAEIARRHDIPATTVRSRLRAALVMLRRTLACDDADWRVALAPLGAIPGAPATLPALAIALALLAILTTAALMLLHAPGPSSATPPPPPPAVASAAIAAPSPALPAEDAAPTYEVEVRGEDDPPPEPGSPAYVAEKLSTLMRISADRVRECYELAVAAGRDGRGEVSITTTVVTWPDVMAQVKIEAGTTVTDPETLECIRENPAAIEEPFERILDENDDFADLTTLELTLHQTLPPD